MLDAVDVPEPVFDSPVPRPSPVTVDIAIEDAPPPPELARIQAQAPTIEPTPRTDLPRPTPGVALAPVLDTTEVERTRPTVDFEPLDPDKKKKTRIVIDPITLEPIEIDEAMAAGDPPPPPSPAQQAADVWAPESRSGSPALQAVEPTPSRGSLSLYNPDGSLALPDEVREQIAESGGDDRRFGFRQPGLEESAEFMKRRKVLEYEPTRFDAAWRPNSDVLTELLERAVEASTMYVDIPIPGSPGSKLRCGVVLLAAGGGCGIVNANDNDAVVNAGDDPNTLSPEEQRQCDQWWEQIVDPQSHAAWRRTRALYEIECRKPPLKDTMPPG